MLRSALSVRPEPAAGFGSVILPAIVRQVAVREWQAGTNSASVGSVLELTDQVVDRGTGVTEQHPGVGAEEQRVLHTSEARIHRTLQHEHVASLIDVDDRHPVQRTAGVFAGSWVIHVVGADHDGDVDGGHRRIYVYGLDERLVGDVGFGQEYVHVTGHAARNRMDRVAHLGVIGFQQNCEFLHGMLRLSDRHSVTGHYDDVPCRFQHIVGVFRRYRRCLTLWAFSSRTGFQAAEATEQYVRQRTVHALAHDLGQDEAAGTNECTRHDEHRVADDEARSGSRDTGVTVDE